MTILGLFLALLAVIAVTKGLALNALLLSVGAFLCLYRDAWR